jgi:hypothetical protein
MIRLSFNGSDQNVLNTLQQKGPRIVEVLAQKITYLNLKLQAHIVAEKLSGQVLNHRSGRLAGSVVAQPTVAEGTSLVGQVTAASGPAWYGRLHEYGGSFIGARVNLKHPPHMVRRARGERVMTGSPYGIFFPERSFMRSSIDDMREEILDQLRLTMRAVILE